MNLARQRRATLGSPISLHSLSELTITTMFPLEMPFQILLWVKPTTSILTICPSTREFAIGVVDRSMVDHIQRTARDFYWIWKKKGIETVNWTRVFWVDDSRSWVWDVRLIDMLERKGKGRGDKSREEERGKVVVERSSSPFSIDQSSEISFYMVDILEWKLNLKKHQLVKLKLKLQID